MRAIRTDHTKTIPSRFSSASAHNPKYEILYLSENTITLEFETGRAYGSLTDPRSLVSVPRDDAQTKATVRVYLTDIVDLTHPEQADLIGTNAQELTGDWEVYKDRKPPYGCPSLTHTGIAPTQQLGEALFYSGVKGFITFSAAVPFFKNLVVFPERLAGTPCTLAYEWIDPSGTPQRLQIP